MKKTKGLLFWKHGAYSLLLLFCFVLQTTPGFLELGYAKPLWVVPAAITIAMLEGELTGGIYGAFAGLLCDMGASTLFGFNGFFLCLFAVGAGLTILYLMRCNLVSCLLLCAASLLLRGSLEFLFVYGMWGYENVWKVYVYHSLPVVLYTVCLTPAVFFVYRKIFRYFQGRLGQ